MFKDVGLEEFEYHAGGAECDEIAWIPPILGNPSQNCPNIAADSE